MLDKTMKRLGASLIVYTAILGYSGLASGQIVGANIITVTTLQDELNEDGDCSLREAIEASNINEPVDACAAGIPGPEGPDQIEFDPALAGGTIVLDLFGGDFEDSNATGDLDILDAHVVIAGPGTGPGSIIIDAASDQVPVEAAPHRALHVPDAASFFAGIELRDLTIRNGRVDPVEGFAFGGGLRVDPSVPCSESVSNICFAMRRVAVVGNSVSSANSFAAAGGVDVDVFRTQGNVYSIEIEDSNVSNNTVESQTADTGAEVDSGGMFLGLNDNEGGGVGVSVSISGSTFDNNTVTASNASAFGGGILIVALELDDLVLRNSSFSNNTLLAGFEANGSGAELELISSNPFPIDISDNRFEGNSASSAAGPSSGGGLFLEAEQIQSFSFTGNNVASNSIVGSSVEAGGAVLFLDSTSDFAIDVSGNIFDGNSASGGAGINLAGGLLFESFGSQEAVFTNNVFSSNSLVGQSSASGGGADVNMQSSSPIVFNMLSNQFLDNSLMLDGNDGSGLATGAGLFLNLSGVGTGTISGSRFSGNSVLSNVDVLSGNIEGGGATLSLDFNESATDGVFSIIDSEFTENSLVGRQVNDGLGGGLAIDRFSTVNGNGEFQFPACPSATCLSLSNTTLSGNFINVVGEESIGGGLYLPDNSFAELNNVTVTTNSVSGSDADGGGIFADRSSQIFISNSVIAGNNAQGMGADCVGSEPEPNAFLSEGFNFIGIDERCNFAAQPSDQVGTIAAPLEAGLDALAFVGDSTTRVHLPLIGSPLVDAGNPDTPGSGRPACEATDQIGTTRPVEGDGDGIPVCDIGAAELLADLPPQIDNPIGDQTVFLDGEDFQIDLDTVFSDPEELPLSYSAFAEDSGIVSTTISGTTLIVTAVGSGSTLVTVTAIDDIGQETIDSFQVLVPGENENLPPTIAQGIPDQNLAIGGDTSRINLNEVFVDPEGEPLTFSASSSNPDVVTVDVDGNDLVLTPGNEGTALVTVIASDTAAQSASIRLRSLAGSGSNAAGSGGTGGASIGGSSSSGGCALGANSNRTIDPMLWLLCLLALASVARRKGGRTLH